MLDGNLSIMTRRLGSDTTQESKMSFQSTLTFFSLMTLVALSCAHTALQPSSYPDEIPHIYCGRRLVTVLTLLCSDEFRGERSEAGTMYNAMQMQEQEKHARDLRLPSRGKRFAVMDCCYIGCTNSELLSFCS